MSEINRDYRLRFGALLKRHRLTNGLSQATLGAMIGKPDQSVSFWERGAYLPKPDAVRALEIALKTSLNDGAVMAEPLPKTMRHRRGPVRAAGFVEHIVPEAVGLERLRSEHASVVARIEAYNGLLEALAAERAALERAIAAHSGPEAPGRRRSP